MENKSCIIEIKEIKEIKINLCTICLDNIKDEKKLTCEHSFCNNCILKWEKESNTCPICRKLIKTKSKKKIRENNFNEGVNTNSIIYYCQYLKNWIIKKIIFYSKCFIQFLAILSVLWIIGTCIWKFVLMIICLSGRSSFSVCTENTFLKHINYYFFEWLLGLITIAICAKGCFKCFCEEEYQEYD